MSFSDCLGAAEFRRILAPLEQVTTRLSPEEADVYYDRLRFSQASALTTAVTILLDTHEYKRFPSIAEIKETMKEAPDQSSRATIEDLVLRNPCPKCHDGYIEAQELTAGHLRSAAIACDCVVGRRRAKQWKRLGLPKARDLGTILRVRQSTRAEWEEVYGAAGPQAEAEEVPF